MKTVLFIGSNPSQKSETLAAFHNSTKSSKILTEWADHIHDCMKMHINVADIKTTNNRPLTTKEIKTSLLDLQSKLNTIQPDYIITLGKSAEKALQMLGVAHYAMPHPSGLNRKLNDKEYVAGKIKGMLEFIQHPQDSKAD